MTDTVLGGVGQEVMEEEAFGWVVKGWGGMQIPGGGGGMVTPGGQKERNRGVEYSGVLSQEFAGVQSQAPPSTSRSCYHTGRQTWPADPTCPVFIGLVR